MFARTAGIKLLHVPYRGSGGAIVDLLAGNIPLLFDSGFSAKSQVDAGKLKILAISSRQRQAEMPDVPTFAEDYPGFESSSVQMLLAPAATPKAIIDRLSDRRPKRRQFAGLCGCASKRRHSTRSPRPVPSSTPSSVPKSSSGERSSARPTSSPDDSAASSLRQKFRTPRSCSAILRPGVCPGQWRQRRNRHAGTVAARGPVAVDGRASPRGPNIPTSRSRS